MAWTSHDLKGMRRISRMDGRSVGGLGKDDCVCCRRSLRDSLAAMADGAMCAATGAGLTGRVVWGAGRGDVGEEWSSR